MRVGGQQGDPVKEATKVRSDYSEIKQSKECTDREWNQTEDNMLITQSY